MKTIHYHDDGKGFPIVWIHGFPFSSKIFEPQVAIEQFRHIRVDLRGFGKTPPAEGETSMATYARDVLDVMDDAKIDRAVIAGLSMGGYIAMQLLRDAPERVAALLLLDTRETADTEDGRATRFKQAGDVAKNGIGSVVEPMVPKVAVSPEARDAIRKIMEEASPEGVIGALKAMASRPDSAETLRSATVPALVVVGDRDEITPPRDAERMVSLLRNAEEAPIAKAAHAANFERPEQLNPLVHAFLFRHVLRPEHASSL
ncbi:MAG TPA: alpha/beta hydrolase [Thermoanaerobaculia bacterium]|jgi:pimeloyl-ACP methyl ester carboxylesterase